MRTHVKPTTPVQGKPRSSRKGDTHSQKWGGGVADTIQAGKERAGSGDEAEGNFFKDPPEDDSYLFMGATAVRDNNRTLGSISRYNDVV